MGGYCLPHSHTKFKTYYLRVYPDEAMLDEMHSLMIKNKKTLGQVHIFDLYKHSVHTNTYIYMIYDKSNIAVCLKFSGK